MTKRDVEKRIVDAALPMLDLPVSSTPEGHAAYLRARRRLERIAVKEPWKLKDFWINYNATKNELMKLEAFGLLRKKKQ